MSARAADVLELLLPEARGERQARARRTVTFLRLLAQSASPRRAACVRLDLAGARDELEQSQRQRLAETLRDLVAHHLAAARPPESFLELDIPQCSHDEAWARLGELRAELPGLPHLPSPGEDPLDVAVRLAACAERLGLAPADARLWRAAHTCLAGGPREGERAFGELLRGPSLEADSRARALAGALACLLDRGAPRQAAALAGEHADLLETHPPPRRLARWATLLVGDEAGARGLAERSAEPPSPPRLPSSLVELRRDRPEWLGLLAGAPARGRTRRGARIEARGEVGAALLAIFTLDPEEGTARPVHVDCAPALRPSLEAWLDGREAACRRPGELERELVARATVVVAHRDGDGAPRGCIDPAAIRAVTLSPICDREGELRGWVRLELEHHLLPSRARLRALARAWREDVRPRPSITAPGPTLEPPDPRRVDPRAEVLSGLVDSLGAKLALRRWWAVVLDAGAPRLVAEGGGALAGWRERPGGARALRRARLARGPVRFDEPDPGASLAADAASGVVVPVVHGERVLALVAVESTRRRDLAGLQGSLERATEADALAVRVASFRAWHQERWGHDVSFDMGVPATAALAEELLCAAAATGPVTLCGPAGVGKRLLARWLHREAGRADGPLLAHACGAHDALAEERELFGSTPAARGLLCRAHGGTLVLDDPERLAPTVQARLEAWLAGEGGSPSDCGAPRLVLSTRSSLASWIASGRLRADLGQRLQRLELHVPSLAERREELGTLARGLVERFAREVDRPAPELDDGALALLWRQPWPGNVRELENVVYRLVLGCGERIGVAQVEEVARRLRLDLVRRIPPREATPELMAVALRCTRTQRGTPNKTRAALYLGWDPDTLGRRLAGAGLDAAGLVG